MKLSKAFTTFAVLFGVLAQANDAEILEIAVTANNGDIQEARLAKSKTRNPQVAQLADQMIKDHSKSNDSLMEVKKKEKLKAQISDRSRELKADAKNTHAKLRKLSDSEFDKAYVDAQVETHNRVLKTLKEELIPQAQNAALKKALEANQPVIEAHLNHATTLKDSM